jgi:P-type E1-E2 ATPase
MYNNSKAEQFNFDKEGFEDVRWRDLSVGKIIKIQKNDVIPADVLILKSSSANGFCYLQTSSLDGETGLKPREAILKMQNIITEEKDCINMKGDILVDPPSDNIYSINGSLNYEDNLYYFTVTNTLLRVNLILLYTIKFFNIINFNFIIKIGWNIKKC